MINCFYNFLCFFYKDLFMWGEGNFIVNVLSFCKKWVDKLFKLIFYDKYFNVNSIFLIFIIVYSFKKFVGFI